MRVRRKDRVGGCHSRAEVGRQCSRFTGISVGFPTFPLFMAEVWDLGKWDLGFLTDFDLSSEALR